LETLVAESVQSRLTALGIKLPEPALPQANYIPTTRSGGILFVSGQVSIVPDGGARVIGKVGGNVSVEQGREAARICAINILAAIRSAVSDLEKVKRILKLVGFVNCTPDFTDMPKVVNGASDLLVEVFGERGRHARSSIGVNSLPLGCAVEVEVIAEVA
jgi:enamine deaminase RidA (YjgF/YER057c/UK114 family)